MVVLLAVAIAVPGDLSAQQRQTVTIASGWVVGVYYPLAGAMSRIAYGARDANIRATVESSGGSVANARDLATGDADFALLQNDIAYYAFNGIALDPFKGKPVKTMAGVFTIYPEVVHVVATRASSIRSIGDLRGKRVALGPKGSGTEQNALQILELYTLRESDLGQAERADAGDAVDHLKAGRLDAAFFTTGVGSAAVVDAFATGQVILVPVSGPEGEALRAKYPFYTVERVAANTYRGQDREVVTPAVRAMLVARRDLPDDLVYRFTKAIFDNLPQFHAAHPAARGLHLPSALSGMPIPLHPGAERFFREKGVAR
jgi:TRAP transporter TAXI family solute receptor